MCYGDFWGLNFVNYVPQKYLIFNPQAFQVLTKKQVLYYPLEFWNNLLFLTRGTFFLAKFYIIELTFFSTFMNCYKTSRRTLVDFEQYKPLKERRHKVVQDIKIYNSLPSKFYRKIKK